MVIVRGSSITVFCLLLILISSLTIVNSVSAQSITEFVNSDDLERASVESVEQFNIPNYYELKDIGIISPNKVALVGSYIDPSNETRYAWFGIYEKGVLSSNFVFGGKYWSNTDNPMEFRNSEFISLDYARDYFYILGNAEVLGLADNDEYIDTSIEFSFFIDDIKINFANMRLNRYSKSLDGIVFGDGNTEDGYSESERIDFYHAYSFLQGGNRKNTKISLFSRNLIVNTFTRLGPFLMDRPNNNSSEAVSFFSSPFGPQLMIADFEGNLQVQSFNSISLKTNSEARDPNFYLTKVSAIGFEESIVTAELGYLNNELMLNINSYEYDFANLLWATNIIRNVTDAMFDLDKFGNSAFLTLSEKFEPESQLLNIYHFSDKGTLRTIINLGQHQLIKTYVTDARLHVITRIDDQYNIITIKIKTISPIGEFIANFMGLYEKSTILNFLGISLLTILIFYEVRKKLDKPDSTELYPEDNN